MNSCEVTQTMEDSCTICSS